LNWQETVAYIFYKLIILYCTNQPYWHTSSTYYIYSQICIQRSSWGLWEDRVRWPLKRCLIHMNLNPSHAGPVIWRFWCCRSQCGYRHMTVLTLSFSVRILSYDGFVVLSADTVIWRFEPGIWSPRFRGL
jgi:hypothetical protein